MDKFLFLLESDFYIFLITAMSVGLPLAQCIKYKWNGVSDMKVAK